MGNLTKADKQKTNQQGGSDFGENASSVSQAPPAVGFETEPMPDWLEQSLGPEESRLEQFANGVGEMVPSALVGKETTITAPNAEVLSPEMDFQSIGLYLPVGERVKIVEVGERFTGSPDYVRIEGLDGIQYGWTRYNYLLPVGKQSNSAHLPQTDAEWDQTVLNSRAGIQLDTVCEFKTRFIDPEIRNTILYSPCTKGQCEGIYKLIYKNRGTPGNIAAKLGEEKMAMEKVVQGAPKLMEEKEAHLAKHIKEGKIKINNGAKGWLKKNLSSGLSEAAAKPIKSFIDSNYSDKKLRLDSAKINELRTLVKNGIEQDVKAAQDNPKIKSLETELDNKEKELQALFAKRAGSEKNEDLKALYSQLAQQLSTKGLYQNTDVKQFRATMEDGTEIDLSPLMGQGKNFRNPGGFKAGGSAKYTDEDLLKVLPEQYGNTSTHEFQTAEKFIHTLRTNEGAPDSLNTWDGEIVTAGPGLSGSGRLQKAMENWKNLDPAGFHDILGRFGLDIVENGNNPYFTLRVPQDARLIPAQMAGKVQPGQFLQGSSSTGAKKSSDKYQECAVLRYISYDPLMLSRIRYAGNSESFRESLIREATRSMDAGLGANLVVHGPDDNSLNVAWEDIAKPLGGEWLAATQAVFAYRYHSSSAKFGDAKKAVAKFYSKNYGLKDPNSLSSSERKALCREVTRQLKSKSYGAYRKQFPQVAEYLFP